MSTIFVRKLNGLLKTELMGKVIHYHEETGSTNSVLYRLAENGASEGTVVVADMQTEGKGRLGRTWISPPGVNLYLSVLLRPSIAAYDAPLLTFTASIAIAETMKRTGIPEPTIKWPNDVVIDGRKAAGVLTEMKLKGERAEFVIVGIGVNINMTAEAMRRDMGEVSKTATSLREALGREIDRAKFTADLLLELEAWYRTFTGRGKSALLAEWTERWGARGQRVWVSLEDKTAFQGIAEGIDNDGHMLVRREDGELVTVVAGDVSTL
ncbi:MAG TPA: biotin--[acetyl-CoA-carboxylase] ligase [Thermodesulfobacteriota bacterium]|nr:biotin--[acetyl-CoA-carboxylase] ligase [Thermodesulfobacteriota bacterium]